MFYEWLLEGYTEEELEPFLKVLDQLYEKSREERREDYAHFKAWLTEKNQKKVFLWTVLATSGGLLFNVIFDPLVGYYYKLLILGKPAAELILAWNIASTTINAVTSAIVSVVIYMALRPVLKKSGLFYETGIDRISKKTAKAR